MQTLVEIEPSNASHVQHRRKDAVLPLRSVGRSNFDNGLHVLATTLIQRRHIIIRTAMLYNEINSGQIMKKKKQKTKTLHIYMYIVGELLMGLRM